MLTSEKKLFTGCEKKDYHIRPVDMEVTSMSGCIQLVHNRTTAMETEQQCV